MQAFSGDSSSLERRHDTTRVLTSDTGGQESTSSHILWIDVLRGAAALAVVCYHGYRSLWIGWENFVRAAPALSRFDQIAALATYPVKLGYTAVMLFFLISGFCIHLPYARATRPFNARSYFIRRFFRIYPPYLAAVALALAVTVLCRTVVPQLATNPAQIAGSIMMVQNYAVHHPQFPIYSAMQIPANSPLWSLPIEAEFYLCYPLLLLAARRWSGRGTVVAVALLSLATVFATHGPALRMLPDFLHYWIIWVVGAVLAEGVARKRLPVWNNAWTAGTLAAFLFCACAEPVFHFHHHNLEDIAWGAAYALIMLYLLTHPLQAGKHKRFERIAGFFGKISYSLYLTHYPVFYLIIAGVLVTFHSLSSNYLVAFALSLPAIPIALLFYVAIEEPSSRLAKRWSQAKKVVMRGSSPGSLS